MAQAMSTIASISTVAKSTAKASLALNRGQNGEENEKGNNLQT